MQDELGAQKSATESVSEENVKIREQLAQFKGLTELLAGKSLKQFTDEMAKLVDEELEREGIDSKKYLNTLLRAANRLSNSNSSA